MANIVEYTKKVWTTEEPGSVVTQIGEGRRFPTEALALSQDAAYRTKVVQAGAIDRILEFMLKTDKPFQEVKKGGDLPCPSIWLNVLNNFCQDGFLEPKGLARDVKFKILVNIGPLFQDMSNFERRELFGERDHWAKCLMFFTNMLCGLLSSENQKLADFMLKQSVLKPFLVRVMFLEIAEPAAVKEIMEFSRLRDNRLPKPDIIGMSETFCAHAIKALTIKRDRALLEEFGATPIRPEHNMTLASGIMKLLETNSNSGWFEGGYAAALNIFLQLYDRYGRISSKVGVESASSKMVQISQKQYTHFAALPKDRYFYENTMTSIVTIGATMMTPTVRGKQAPIDYNVARAVECDVLDYCLDCCDSNDMRLSKPLEGLIRGPIASCSGLDETGKALKSKVPSIRSRIERVKARAPYLFQNVNIIEQMVDKVLPKDKKKEEDPTCEFCFEKADKGTTTKCQFCKSILYCSMDCQRLNWMLHQNECKETRKSPLPKSTDELHADGKLMFGQEITKILLQASLKGMSILESFVVVDMCEATPLLKTYTLEQFAAAYIQDEDAITLSKNIMAKNVAAGAITVSFAGFTPEGLNASLLTFPPSTAPPLPSVTSADELEKWTTAQKVATQTFFARNKSSVEKIRGNTQLWQATLLKTMKP